MKQELREKMIAHVNRRAWWHVPPLDPDAYRKRGKFLASSYREACFWGRPLNDPQRVMIANPLVGDEATIERRLFGRQVSTPESSIAERFKLDMKMKTAALARGYDSIILSSPASYARFRSRGRVPRSLELNLLLAIPNQGQNS